MKKERNYIGNKNINGVKEKIIGVIPFFSVFIECFAGSAGIANYVYGRSNNIVLVEKCKSQSEILKKNFSNGIVINECAISYLNEIKFVINPNAFVFADPPYLFDTRHNNNVYYNNELDNNDHVQLLMTILQLPCRVAIVHPICNLYDKMLFNWNYLDYKVRYHRKSSLERIYYNYNSSINKFDYELQGSDSLDRQRIKRKALRFLNKFKNLPDVERKVILHFLKKENLI
jgi:site-specific DNA-adenine methylase